MTDWIISGALLLLGLGGVVVMALAWMEMLLCSSFYEEQLRGGKPRPWFSRNW